MLRIFMTGDNHIGLKYVSHSKAAVLAEKRISAFDEMVETANRENCGLFVITGDLFESVSGITDNVIKKLTDKLSEFGGIVAVLPGNHDYFNKDAALWRNFEDKIKSKHNIMLLTEYRPYEIDVGGENVVLYPAFCDKLHSAAGENKLGWIKDENIVPDGKYRIGIAHGAIEGETIDSEGKYFLMKRSELESIPVDAWLIGHTHVPIPSNITWEFMDCGRIFNAGTHVQTDVSCNTEGLCFIVEIDGEKNVRAKKVRSGNIRFHRFEVKLSAGEAESNLEYALKNIGDDSCVDITLSGAITPEEYENRQEMYESKLSRFIEEKHYDSDVTQVIDEELIRKEFPETSVSAKVLMGLLNEPKEAQLMYDLLNEIKEENKR